jgi:hypothetical protein
MAPYGSAIKACPSGQIMATPMITRRGGYPVRYAKPVASARLVAFRRKRPIDGRTADEQYELALLSPVNQLVHCKICNRHLPHRMTGKS